MTFNRPFSFLTTAALGLAAAGNVWADEAREAELQRIIADLRVRNTVLEQGITEANRAEKHASEQLAQVRSRMEALGRDLLAGGDERLIQATADIQVLNDRISSVEGSAMRFSSAVSDYLRTALASDPDARLRVESSMRELDEVLGLRQKPAPTNHTGTASRAKVMSIDAESGMLVFNIGELQTARIGTTYRLYRGDQPYGTAIIADVRREISGAFVESLESDQGPVRLGDLAILETE